MKALRATSASLTSPSSQTNVLATWVTSVLYLLAVTGGYLSSPPVLAAENLAQPVEMKTEYIYKNNCSVCHGDRGDGRSRASTSLVPPPRNFTTASNLTRDIMIATVTNGKPGTAMTSWKTQLSEQQIAAVVDYVRDNFMQEVIDQHLSYGRLVYGHNCASCHGDKGQGVKPAWYAAAPRSFTSPQAAAELNRERMIAAVANGLPGSAMTGYADKLSMGHIEAVVDYTLDVLMAATAGTRPACEPSSRTRCTR